MGRIGLKAAAVLLSAALVASACGDDGGDGDSAASGSPVDDVLGMQAVQDFAIHLEMWVVADDDSLVDFYGPLLDSVSAEMSAETVLNGGMVFAPTDELTARVVNGQGVEMPSVSVDFGLIGPSPAENSAIDEELGRAADAAESAELIDALRTEPDGPGPLLVEIITASYDEARVHVAPGDRSEIDVTFLDEVEPGDRAIVSYLFGQTLPGDPATEATLSAHELFAYRWNAGLVQVYGWGGVAQPLVDQQVALIEGSTILTRDQKRELAELAGAAAGRQNATPGGPVVDALQELWDNRREVSTPDGEVAISQAEMPLPLTDETAVIVFERAPETTSHAARNHVSIYVDGVRLGTWPKRNLPSVLKILRVFAACSVTAARLQAQNEAGRRVESPFAHFPTSRPLAPGLSTTAPLGSEEPPEEPDPEGTPPLGCEPEPDPPPPGGGVHGDVRVTTIDGITYGQQATGEFLVFENDTMVVQMRAEPAGDSQGLSIATAFAVGTGGASISMHAGGHTYVDGELRVLDRGERIRVGDAEVLWGYFDGWTIAWPDGQLVKIFDRGDGDGMSLTVQPGPGTAVGQLGDGDGDPDNDFVTRDGAALSPSIVDDFDAFYGTYVESWRLTQDESLLHYDAGETTESFLIEGFPSSAVTMEDLDPGDRADAEAVCQAASVVDDALFEGCVIDVASTGDAGYAYDAFRVQLVTVRPGGSDGDDPEPSDDVPAGTPGDTVLTIGGAALVFGADPPNQRDGGVAPSWDCQITDGNVFADGSIDLADGPRYAIDIQYLAAEPHFSLTVRRTVDDQTGDHAWVLTNVAHFADAVDDVTLDGTRLTATGEIFVNDPPQLGLAPFSQLPAGATLDPFTLDLDCAS